MDVKDLYDEIENDILHYSLTQLSAKVLKLAEVIYDYMIIIRKYKEIEPFNQILNHIYIALQNKDYYLIIDLLKFELIPYYERMCS